MWFSLYRTIAPQQINLHNPIPEIFLIEQGGGGARFYSYRDNGQKISEHWLPSVSEAQIYAADRLHIPGEMWVNTFDLLSLERFSEARDMHLYHLVRCLGQSCRPVSVIDYAIQMKYEPKACLYTFAEVRTMVRAQLLMVHRHRYALPYVRRSLVFHESFSFTAMLYRTLTFVDERRARATVGTVEAQLLEENRIAGAANTQDLPTPTSPG